MNRSPAKIDEVKCPSNPGAAGPPTATVAFKKSAGSSNPPYNGMTGRDWGIFLESWLVSNLLWIAVCQGGISALAAAWRNVAG